MSQVNIIQYAEIYTGSGPPLRIGSKVTPSTITLTGTGEVYHHVYNDNPASTYKLIYSTELSGLKFFAVKSSTEAMLAFRTDGFEGMSTAHLDAGVWQFFGEGSSTASVVSLEARASGTEVPVEFIGIYNLNGATAQDIEIVVAY